MNFILRKLKIRNFKGIKEQDIEFDPISTTISGENGTGKTTVVDAFTWLLFEKDSKGRAQFEIKTLENGEQLHGLDHSVEGVFEIDGRPLKLKKTYREVWTKRRGEDHETFTGHEIERIINDIPAKKTEYEKKIGELVDEKIFQLLTDPLYFSQQLGWKERRGTLFELSGGDISTEEVIGTNPELKAIEGDLEDKTIEELKKSLSYQRKELNKKRTNIPVRIETLNSTIKEIDKQALETQKEEITEKIDRIESQMLDATKLGEEQLKKQDELYLLKSKQKEIEHEIKNNIKDPDEDIKRQISEFNSKSRELESEIKSESKTLEMLEKNINRENDRLKRLRERYKAKADETLTVDENIKLCPTCKRAFPEDEVENQIKDLENNFKTSQVRELTRLREEGQAISKEVEEYQQELEETKIKANKLKEEKQLLETAIKDREDLLGAKDKPDIQSILEENEEYQEVKTKISDLETEIKNTRHETTIEDLKKKKKDLELKLKETEKELHQEEINQETKEKIEELMTEEKELSQQISEIERKENIADKYITAKTELIEKNINDKFEKVTFRLFKRQTNGALDETCDVLVEGVPFDNANTAGQVNAGLDVINSLCKHYDTYTLIFIDNRESINNLIATDSQLVNLKVTKHKTLRVETE